MKAFVYQDKNFLACCGTITYLDDQREVNLSIASMNGYGVYLGFSQKEHTYLSLSDRSKLSNLLDVWGDPDSYIQKGAQMKYTWLDEFLLDMKGVTKDYKVEWNWNRYLLGDKMFAAVCLNGNGEVTLITLKLNPVEGDFLRQQYEDIIPGYYMNKVHWNSVKADGAVPDDLLKDMLLKSYKLVFNKLSKKKQKELIE